jgi:acetyl esterase/lipase
MEHKSSSLALHTPMRLFFIKSFIRLGIFLSFKNYRLQRLALNAAARCLKRPKGIAKTWVKMQQIRCAVFNQDGMRPTRAVLMIHGGGFTVGSTAFYSQLASHYAASCEAAVYLPEYSLAPEHPFPVAQDEVLTCYRYLLEQGFAPQNIIVVGDSAGGNLALALMIEVRDKALPLPACAVLISPWLDLTCTGESHTVVGRRDPMLSKELLTEYARHYLSGRDRRDPRCSPLFADLSGLPPMLLQVGSEEVLLDDARRFAALAAQAGLSVQLEVWPGMFHVWHLWAVVLPQALHAIRTSGAFCKEQTATAVPLSTRRAS